MIGRVVGPALTIAVAAGAIWGWIEIDLLRGTVFWEFRYLLLGGGTILALSAAEWVIGRVRGSGR